MWIPPRFVFLTSLFHSFFLYQLPLIFPPTLFLLPPLPSPFLSFLLFLFSKLINSICHSQIGIYHAERKTVKKKKEGKIKEQREGDSY